MSDNLRQITSDLGKITNQLKDLLNNKDIEPNADRRRPKQRIVPDRNQNPFRFKSEEALRVQVDPQKHVYGAGFVCKTEKRGYPTPDNRSPSQIRVDISQGIVPLWEQGTTLRWRFNESSMLVFDDPNAAKAGIEALFSDAIAAWGDSCPVRFLRQSDQADFEFVMLPTPDCDATGCVLAQSFFPNSGQNSVLLYPTLFDQSQQERVETFIHEFGHVFGLRHWFANISETDSPSELFGQDSQFSIMNYGADSFLTDVDKSDLKELYKEVWSGARTEINGTPIRLFAPFHSAGTTSGGVSSNFSSGRRRCNCGH